VAELALHFFAASDALGDSMFTGLYPSAEKVVSFAVKGKDRFQKTTLCPLRRYSYSQYQAKFLQVLECLRNISFSQ